MKINTNIKINRFFLDITPNIITVISENAKNSGDELFSKYRDRPDTFKFITRKKPSDEPNAFFTVNDYHLIFYRELRRLIDLIKGSPDYTFYITPLGFYKNDRYDIFNNIIKPRLTHALQDFDNVIFTWDPETIDKTLTQYWGFVDVQGRYNIFLYDDIAVPFKHKYMKTTYSLEAYSKDNAVNLIKKNPEKYVIS